MQNQKSDELLIEKIRNGDKSQLANIYRTYRSEFMTWITTNYRCSRDEAGDLYQVSVLALYENIAADKLQTLSSSIKTYLFAIGKNKALEMRKSEARFEAHAAEPQIEELTEAVEEQKKQDEAHLKIMAESLEKLGDPCKALLELYYFHDMSMEEIAAKLGYKNAGTTKNMKCKCLARLRKIFKSELNSIQPKAG